MLGSPFEKLAIDSPRAFSTDRAGVGAFKRPTATPGGCTHPARLRLRTRSQEAVEASARFSATMGKRSLSTMLGLAAVHAVAGVGAAAGEAAASGEATTTDPTATLTLDHDEALAAVGKGILPSGLGDEDHAVAEVPDMSLMPSQDDVKTLGVVMVGLWLLKVTLGVGLFVLYRWLAPFFFPRRQVTSGGPSDGVSFYERLFDTIVRGSFEDSDDEGPEVVSDAKIKYKGVLYARVAVDEESS